MPWAPQSAKIGLFFSCAAMVCACDRRPSAAEGVIVRQVLHGADAVQQSTGPLPQATAPAARSQPGQVPATLVTDSPQAAYKAATDRARKQLETDTARAALNRLETQIEQEQESPP